MPLNFTTKTNPNNPTSQAPARPTVQLNPQTQSTARANALKERLRTGAQPQTAAPRPAGSSLRAQQYATQPRYPTPPPVAAPPPAPAPTVQPMGHIEPPPSGLAAPTEAPGVPATSAPIQVTPQEAPGAQPTTVAAPTARPAEATSEQPNAQFSALAREARKIQRDRQALQAERDAWKQEQAGYFKKDLLTGPDALKNLAEHFGLTPDRLVELQVAQANPDPNQALLDRIAQLETKLASVDKTFAERDSLQEEQALRQYKADAELLVDSDPAYETIAALKSEGSVQKIVDLIRRVFDEEGVLLPVEEAAREVEQKLRASEQSRYDRITKLTYMKSKLAPATPPAPPVTEGQAEGATPPQPKAAPVQQPPAPTQRTLTNQGASQRPMSPRDRVIAKLRGEM